MKFRELNHTAQLHAIQEYKQGWEETHDENDLSDDEITWTLLDEEHEFDVNGNYLTEDELNEND
jgi:hypothetical protein